MQTGASFDKFLCAFAASCASCPGRSLKLVRVVSSIVSEVLTDKYRLEAETHKVLSCSEIVGGARKGESVDGVKEKKWSLLQEVLGICASYILTVVWYYCVFGNDFSELPDDEVLGILDVVVKGRESTCCGSVEGRESAHCGGVEGRSVAGAEEWSQLSLCLVSGVATAYHRDRDRKSPQMSFIFISAHLFHIFHSLPANFNKFVSLNVTLLGILFLF